jgi:hypothetical protein
VDSITLHINSMPYWLSIILHSETIGILLSNSHFFQIFATVTCDQIWYARNKTLHEELVPNALVISSTINRIVKNHHSAWINKLVPYQVVWKEPSPPFYKINYDTTIRQSFLVKAALCRDFIGSIIHCSTIISPPCITVYGEATATLLAVCLDLPLSLSSVILEGD